jgi:hypothetical protein
VLWSRASTALILACLLPGPICAQSSSASYAIPRQSIDGGAARSTSASYTVEATLGQPDADLTLSSASYQLKGGFHRLATATGPLPDAVFEDSFETP